MNTTTLLILLPLAIFLLLAVLTYPRIGELVYRLAIGIEARLYGFRKTQIDGGDIQLAAYQGGPATAAQTLILIHGYSADKDVWLRFGRRFTDRYRVLILDMAGHGETPYDPALAHDTTSQALRVLRAMDALGISRAHLIGNSMGGFITARFAHDHPDRIKSATLIDAAGVQAPEPSEMEQWLAQGKNPFLIQTRQEFQRFYAMTMEKAPWVPGIALDYIADLYIARRERLAKIFQDFFHGKRLDGQLAAIQTPTLVLWGAHDKLVSASAAAVWGQGIRNSRVMMYHDLGHMPMVEAPAQCAADVRQFIESVS